MKPFVRPKDPVVLIQKETVPGSCPECRSERLARYPVLTEGGWWLVTKCQDCLASVERKRWHLLGYLSPLSELL